MAEDLCPVSSNDQFSDLSFEHSLFIAIYVAIWKHRAACGMDPSICWGSWCFPRPFEEQWHGMSHVSNSWVPTTLNGFFPPSPQLKTWFTLWYNLCKCHLLTKTGEMGPLQQSEPHGSSCSRALHWALRLRISTRLSSSSKWVSRPSIFPCLWDYCRQRRKQELLTPESTSWVLKTGKISRRHVRFSCTTWKNDHILYLEAVSIPSHRQQTPC